MWQMTRILESWRSSVFYWNNEGVFKRMNPPRYWWRSLLLLGLLLLSILSYIALFRIAPQPDQPITRFVSMWFICFLPYLGASAYVFMTKPLTGRWFWIEPGIILVGTLIFYLMLLPLPTGLSRDAWRYLWDARVIVHGYSPYVYAPGDKVLLPLRDILYYNCRFRNIPTDYPPGAEGIYVLSYLLSPTNLYGLKAIFLFFEMVTCGALMLLLARKGLDPRRAVIYAWCPLPIVEIAIEGHVDAMTVMFIVLALLSATSNKRGGRALTGFLLGIATLTRIYPIILLAVVVRPRDWSLLLTCFITIVLGYIPFIILGHGQVLGFLPIYLNQQGGNAGPLQQYIAQIGHSLGLTLANTITLEHIVDVILLGTMTLIVLMLRLRERISMEAATLLLISTVFVLSSHIFPWYTIVLLPLVAVLIGPIKVFKKRSGKELAIVITWYILCTIPLSYISSAQTIRDTPDWFMENVVIYFVNNFGTGSSVIVIGGLILAAIIGITSLLWRRRETYSDASGSRGEKIHR
jgi:hypothetical protein